MTRFQRKNTALSDVYVLERMVSLDERGSFDRIFDAEDLAELLPRDVQQINLVTNPLAGTVRGLHLQLPPEAETKVVTCIQGSIFDVAVDLRRDSENFGRYVGVVVSGSEPVSIVIPAGFAHGYQTLEVETKVLYMSTARYCPPCESGLNPFDEALGIDWPMACTLISTKDQNRNTAQESFLGVEW